MARMDFSRSIITSTIKVAAVSVKAGKIETTDCFGWNRSG